MSKFRRQLMMASMGEPVPPPTPYIEWLKSLGCLTWLPLTEGDLEDKITETTLTISGNGSMTWDSNENMYKFITATTTGKYIAKLSNGLASSQFTNNELCVLTTAKKVTSSSSYSFLSPSLISSASDTLTAITCVMYGGTGRSDKIPTGTHKYAKSYTANERLFFYDGNENASYGGYAAQMPSNWSVSETGLYFGFTFNTGYRYTIYLADIYIFTTALPLSTIRQIQGYDPLPDGVIR